MFKTAVRTTPSSSLSFFYPWVICLVSVLSVLIINGLTTTALSAFDKELIQTFGWSRAELKLRASIGNFTSFALVFVIGLLIDRFRVKRLILFGTFTLSIALILYSQITNKWQAYGLHFLLGLSLITAGSVPNIILVSSWFERYKGLALGLTLAGTSLGGFIFPVNLVKMMATVGWRDTFLWISILPLVLFLLVFFFVKNNPEEIGLKPLGAQTLPHSEGTTTLAERGLSFEKAIQTRSFWLICICGAFSFYSVVALIEHTFLHTMSLGFDESQASQALGVYFAIAFMGKFLISTLSDFINPYLVIRISFVIMTVGCLGYLLADSSQILMAIAITGLGWGGLYSLYNIITVKTFGLKSAGRINGSISMAESLGAFIAPTLTGYLFDVHKNYDMAFTLIIGLMVACSLLSLFLKEEIQ
jgi:sugar phosphate permease